MNEKEINVEPPAKSFMTAGPTLHYSHPHVYRHWWATIILYTAVCLFWSKIITGTVNSLQIATFQMDSLWSLGRYIIEPISIFEYPWHILVLGITMGILAVVPMLMSQLLSSRYSVLFLLMLAVVAKLPDMALVLTLGCVAIATRPLRFRSRFISLVLCSAPLLIYLGLFGGIKSTDPIRWGFSFAPWLTTWITTILIASIVLGIGHFTRYRPGITWLISLLFFATAIIVFSSAIGFAEADYQIYIRQNNPLEIKEFHSRKVTPILDDVVRDSELKNYLSSSFYSQEPILLRAELKRELQDMLRWNHWPEWFADSLPEDFNYEKKRNEILASYEIFIKNHPENKRMPIALYYKGIAKELSPDINAIGTDEELRFYIDHPKREVLPVWTRLYKDFPESPESIEARWRIAMHLAGKGDFKTASALCNEAMSMIENFTGDSIPEQNSAPIFKKPENTVITKLRAEQLKHKLLYLRSLIDGQNQTGSKDSQARLAKFVMLDPHSLEFKSEIDNMLEQLDTNDPLRDNLELAKAELIPDTLLKEKKLEDIILKYNGSDSAKKAYYELGLLRVQLWRNIDSSNSEERNLRLKSARSTFEGLLKTYPDSIYTKRTVEILKGLPVIN